MMALTEKFSGDLFNTSLPSLEILKIVAKKLKQLQQKGIPLYAIPGSHDFSPSGKTMIDVLENAGLLINVCKGKINPETKQLELKFTIDQKTGAKITGMLGRKGMLDKTYYENLNLKLLETEPGYKIFLFHTTLSELKPKHLEMMEGQPASFLPKGFNYYAGGHVHHPTQQIIEQYGLCTYPGAIFPNNFSEIEKYSHGGYLLIDDELGKIEWIPIKVINHIPIKIDCTHKIPSVITFDLLNSVNNLDLTNTLITIKLTGTLDNGKISEINFPEIFQRLYQQGAYWVMKNTAQLQTNQFEEIKIDTSSPENIEEEIIKEHLQQVKVYDKETELQLTKQIFQTLNTEKKEGETIRDFQQRVKEEMNQILKLELEP